MSNIFLTYNWGSTKVQHRITSHLCESIDVESVGATVVGREPYEYLTQQTDIDYDPLYCVQDVHDELVQKPYDPSRIDKLEERFGVPSLWPAIWADRKYINYDPETQKRLIQGWFDHYLNLFETFQPDLLVTSSVDSAYTWIPFRIVTEEYGTAVQKSHTRIRDRRALQKTVSDTFEGIWDIAESIKSPADLESSYPQSYNKALNFLEEFRSTGLSPGYTENKNKSSSNVNQSVVNKTVSYWYKKNFGYYQNDFYHESTRERVKTNFKWLLWKKLLERLNMFREPKLEEKFIYFPLHLQPEASTMVKAPMYLELQDVIRDISKSLPINHKLYVKEHPRVYEYKVRPVDYYQEIADLPNTRLIHPKTDSHRLIKNAEAVTTVTGTAGLEGLLYKKPVITFGKPNYDKLPQVYTAGDPKELSNLIFNALENHIHTDKHENKLLRYLTAIFEESYPDPCHKTGDNLEKAINKQCEVLQRDVIPNGN